MRKPHEVISGLACLSIRMRGAGRAEPRMIVLQILYFSFPVMPAAAVHIVVIKLNWMAALRKPMDFGKSFRGRRIFGDNKTWRGAVVMIAVSAAGMLLQQAVRIRSLEPFDYGSVNALLAGAMLGPGFVVGELPNSFLKRRFDVPPGQQAIGLKYWVFTTLDQIDSVVGCLLAICPFWVPPWEFWVAALVLCSLVHIAFNLVFVMVGLKKRAV